MNLNNIFQNEIGSTLGSLLSLEDVEVSIESISFEDIDIEEQLLEVKSGFAYSTISSPVKFLISASDAYAIEHKMLGESEEIKTAVDDNLLDAIKEITSNITGAISNSINAQDDETLQDVKFQVEDIQAIDDVDTKESTQALKINIDATNGNFIIYILIDDILNQFFDSKQDIDDDKQDISESKTDLSHDESENLKLLLGIELKLSVRLGSKEMLLKDIVKLDLGDIVELDQLVNEPLDILVNGTKIAEGEAVVVDGKFAVKVKNIGSAKERISYIRLGN